MTSIYDSFEQNLCGVLARHTDLDQHHCSTSDQLSTGTGNHVGWRMGKLSRNVTSQTAQPARSTQPSTLRGRSWLTLSESRMFNIRQMK